MRRNETSDLVGILIIGYFLVMIVFLVNTCLSIIIQHFGYQFRNNILGYFISGIFIILVLLLIFYFKVLKEFILLKVEILFNKKNIEILLENFKIEYENIYKNYQKLKTKIDEIDEIL